MDQKPPLFQLTKLRTLVALLLVILTPAIVFYGAADRSHNRSDQQAALKEFTGQVADVVQTNLNEKIDEQKELANSTAFKDTPLKSPSFDSALQDYQSKHPDFAWVGIADTKGTIVHDTQKLLVGVDASRRPWFIYGKERTYFGDLHEATLLQNILGKAGKDVLRLVDIANPIYDAKQTLKGVVSVHIYWQWADKLISKYFGEESQSKQIEVYIVSSGGKVIFPATDLIVEGINAPLKANTSYLISKQSLNVQAVDEDKQWQIFTRQPIQPNGLKNANNWLLIISSLVSFAGLIYLIVGWIQFRRNQ